MTISSIGLLTNLEALLKSSADGHSSLSGRDLVARKVRYLAVMGGEYPRVPLSSSGSCGCNFCAVHRGGQDHAVAAAAAAYVVAHIPAEVQVVFTGGEAGIQVWSGARLISCAPVGSPCRAAYTSWEQTTGEVGRYSWDPLSLLVAVRGPSGAGCAMCSDCDG